MCCAPMESWRTFNHSGEFILSMPRDCTGDFRSTKTKKPKNPVFRVWQTRKNDPHKWLFWFRKPEKPVLRESTRCSPEADLSFSLTVDVAYFLNGFPHVQSVWEGGIPIQKYKTIYGLVHHDVKN